MGRDGGPAFPLVRDYDPAQWKYEPHPGMTLRDWFAGQALAFLAHPARLGVNFHPKDDAEFAYAVADAMLAAREADDGA